MATTTTAAAAHAAGGGPKPTIPTSEAQRLKQEQQQPQSQPPPAWGPPDWLLEYDHKTGHYYHFNVRTGESRWAEEADFLGGQQGHEEEEARGLVVDDGAGVEQEDGGGDDEEPRSQGMVVAFTAMFLFHGCCIEGPLAAIEGLLRAPFYLLGGFWLLLLSPCAEYRAAARARAGLWLREAALFLAAGLSLLLPGMALFAYRNFHPDAEEWDVAPIPTLLGRVDPRRFYVFNFGQGSVAGNSYYDADLGSMDALGQGILHPPRRLDIARAFVHTAELTNGSQFRDDDDEEEEDEAEAVLWSKGQQQSLQQPQKQPQATGQQQYTTVSSSCSVASNGSASALVGGAASAGHGEHHAEGHEEQKGGERFPRSGGGHGGAYYHRVGGL